MIQYGSCPDSKRLRWKLRAFPSPMPMAAIGRLITCVYPWGSCLNQNAYLKTSSVPHNEISICGICLLKRAYDRSLIVRHDLARQREGDAVIPPILPRMEARRHARPALERRNNRARPDVFNGRRSPLV